MAIFEAIRPWWSKSKQAAALTLKILNGVNSDPHLPHLDGDGGDEGADTD